MAISHGDLITMLQSSDTLPVIAEVRITHLDGTVAAALAISLLTHGDMAKFTAALSQFLQPSTLLDMSQKK